MVQFHDSNSRWGDLIDFIRSRTVYMHITVRLLYWFSLVHSQQDDEATLVSHISTLAGRLAMSASQVSKQRLMEQLIQEYRHLDQYRLAMNEDKTLALTDFDGMMKVDVFDVIMKHLALFNYPIQPCVLLSCPDLFYRLKASGDSDVPSTDPQDQEHAEKVVQHALSELVARGLVVRINSSWTNNDETGASEECCRYVLHRDAAKVVVRDMSYITQYSLSAAPYQTTFYCAQVQSRRGAPSVEHFNFVSNLLKSSLSKSNHYTHRNDSHRELSGDETHEASAKNKLGFYRACAIVRGAYAILRGSFSVGAVSRLGLSGDFHNKQPYQVYRSWIQDIINSAVGLSEYRHRVDQTDYKDKLAQVFDTDFNLPLYREEVSWLYNEYAVVSFMQGRLFDSGALYNQALRVLSIQKDEEEDQSVGAPIRRILVNKALTEIELGNIHHASLILDRVMGEISITPHSTTSVTLIYAQGYRALCDHLTGNFTQAESAYRDVIDKVLNMRQLRAASIFKRHLADLLRVQGKLEAAGNYLLRSEKTAIQSQQEDILHYTLIAKARLMRDMDSRREALLILRKTEEYAKAMGLQKMLAETLKVRAEVMLAEGEVTQAGKMAAQAVAISKRHGMRLRKISAALLQAEVCAKRGQLDFSKQILNEIDQEANELGYTLKSGDAQKFRQSLM